MIATIITTGIGYLLGSIPFGLIAGKLVRGIDVRNYGSKRTGGTNVLRVLGPRWAITVGLLDVLKAAAAALIGRSWGGDPGAAAALAAFAAAVGHIYPIFAGFRGGRGVATMLGGMLVIAWPAVVVAIVIAVAVIKITRYVSLGSILAAASTIFTVGLLFAAGDATWHSLAYAVAVAILVIAVHYDNIQRLRAGVERKFGQRISAVEEPQGTGQ